jgi:hypothetical protein
MTYVTDGIESALAQARKAAGHKNVSVIEAPASPFFDSAS